MKTLDFFISKAKEYSSTIDEIQKHYISPYTAFDSSLEYQEQKRKILDLKLKVKLLFSEFENGEIFNSEVKIADKDRSYALHTDELLEVYKHVLSLFIDHIVEFKK